MFHTAEVDLDALSENLVSLVADSSDPDAALDVRGDARGLGLVEVCQIAACSGVRAVLVTRAQRAIAQAVVGDSVRIATEPAGLSVLPSDTAYGFTTESRAVMSVRAVVLASKVLSAGDGVSYGHTFITPRDTHTALIAVGYGDGLDRSAGGRGSVRISGKDYPLVGRVAMNAAVVDTGEDVIPVGRWATLFGNPSDDAPAITSWSDSIDRSPTEVAIGFGAHLPRRYGGRE